MACIYKYKGTEYTSREDLTNAIAQEQTTSTTSPNKMMYEVNGNAGIAEAQLKARQDYGTDEFLTFIEKDNKTYMLIDERLFKEQTGSNRIIIDENGQEQEVDIDEEIAKFAKGNTNPPLSLYFKMLERVYDRVIQKTLTDLAKGQTEQQQDIMTVLNNFAAGLGISITTMEDYKRNYQERHGVPPTVEALADIFNKVIALSNKNDKENLSEEVSHFAIEYYKDQDVVNQMLAKVDQTDTYKRYAVQYRQAYSKEYSGEALETKVRKEILGKLLSENILNNFNTQGKGLNETGIINRLKELLQQFLDLFRKTDSNRAFFKEYGKVLDMLSSDVTNPSGFTNFAAVDSKEVYYSMTEQDQVIHDKLTDIRDTLVHQFKQIHESQTQSKRAKGAMLAQITDEITNTEYARAIHSFIHVIKEDMVQADNNITRAENNVVNSLEKRKILERERYVEPTEKEKQDKLAEELGSVNTHNIITSTNNIDTLIDQLNDALDYLSRQDNKTSIKGEISRIKKSLSELNTLKSRVKPRLESITKSVTAYELGKELVAAGLNKEQAQKEVDNFLIGNNVDIKWYEEYLMGFNKFPNKVSHLISAETAKAYAKSEQSVRVGFDKLITKLNELGTEKTKLLWADGYFLSDIDYRKADIAYDDELKAIEKKRVDAIAALDKTSPDYEEKVDEIEERTLAEKDKFFKEWEVQRTTVDFDKKVLKRKTVNPITKSKFRTKGAVDFIQGTQRDKRNITKRHISSATGLVDYTGLTKHEKERLQQIKSDLNRFMSLYNEDGTAKQGNLLAMALDVRDYYESNGMEISEEAKQLFEKERAEAQNKLTREDYNKWLESYSYATYPEQLLPQDTLKRVVDVEKTEANINPEILDEIKSSVVIPNLNGKEPTLQQIYDALTEKREQLIKPYRRLGDSSEIEGEFIENNDSLMGTLETIREQMSYFRFNEKAESNFRQVPNQSFITKYNKLRNSSLKELNAWLKDNAKKDTNGDYQIDPKTKYPVPLHRHYSKYELLDENQNPIPKETVPTYYWEMRVQDRFEVNPEFNERMAGKARQYTKEKKQQFRNQKYFDTFAPDAQGNPTKNKDLYQLRNHILEVKDYYTSKVPSLRNIYYMWPQVPPHNIDAITSAGGIKYKLKDAIFFNKYDEEINPQALEKGQKEGRFLPIHYHKREEDLSVISDNLGYIMHKWMKMTSDYEQKSRIIPRLLVYKHALGAAQFKGKGRGETTNIYKRTDEFISANIYGNQYAEFGTWDFGKTPVLNKIPYLKNEKLSFSKSIRSVYSYRSIVNLAFSPFVPVVGAISSYIQRSAMVGEGKYGTQQGLDRANKMTAFGAGVLKTVQDLGKIRPDSYLGKLDVFSGVRNLDADLAKGSFASNRLSRLLQQSNPFFINYELIGKITALKTVVMVYDNFRLIDGEFITFRTFEDRMILQDGKLTRKEILKEWKKHQSNSFMDFIKDAGTVLEIDKQKLEDAGFKGNLQDLKARIDTAALSANQAVEAQASGLEKTLSARNPLYQLAFWLHKGYFQRFVEARFQRRQFDTITGAEEEGTYQSFIRIAPKAFKELTFHENLIFWLSYFYHFKQHDHIMNKLGLDNVDKVNTRRIRKDIRLWTGALAFYVMANMLADDDERKDDYIAQYAAYIASRVFNETSTTQLPFGANDIFKLFQSPSSGLAFIEDFFGLPGLLVTGREEIERGKYAGFNEWEKTLIKNMPIKNVFEAMIANPRQSNIWFRQNMIPKPIEHIYKSWEQEIND